MAWYNSYFTADYWAYADAEYTQERTEAEVAYLATLLRQHAPGKRILDLGCGTGRHAIALARLGFQVTGVDVSAYALSRAAQAAADAGVRIQLHQADLLGPADWGVPPADAAICVQAFGWGSDADQLRMLRTVRRLLPDDGVFVLDHSSILAITGMYQPSAEARIGGATFVFSREYDPLTGRSGGHVQVTRPDASTAVLPDNVRLYTPAEVGALLTRAGFDVTQAAANFQAGAPVTIATRYVQFLATPRRRIASALDGHRAQPPDGTIDLRSAPDEADFSQEAVTAAWARLSSDPLGLPTLARRYDLADPYGGTRAAPILATNLAWPPSTARTTADAVPAANPAGPVGLDRSAAGVGVASDLVGLVGSGRSAAGVGVAADLAWLLSPDRVAIGAGVTGLLHSLARLADGGTVLFAPTGHPQLAEAAGAAGIQVAVAPLTDPAAAAAAVAKFRPSVTVLDRPALTGRHWSVPMVAALAGATAQVGGVLVVDESCGCYLPPGTSAAPLTDTTPGMVVLRGISKGYCSGGLRIGFAIASPGLAATVRAALPPLAACALSLSVALDLFSQPDPLTPLRARIAEVKPVIQAAVQRAGLPVIETDDHVPWLTLPAAPSTRAALAHCGLVVKDVPVLPATVPDTGEAASGLLRMSLPLSAQRLEAVMAALSRSTNLVAP